MPLDDAIRRAEAHTDDAAEKRRAAEAYQTSRVPRAVEKVQGLLRDAVREFQAAKVKPKHVLRVRKRSGQRPAYPRLQNALLNKINPREDEFEMLLRGWNVDRYLLGSDGKIYYVHGRENYRMTSLQEAENSKRQPTPEAVRGLLKIGLVPGDSVVIFNKINLGDSFDEVDLRNEMYASPAELVPHDTDPDSFSTPVNARTSESFVVSPAGVIFMKQDNYESHYYRRLEDVLARAIVSQRP